MSGSVARSIAKVHGGKTSESLRVPVDALYFDPKFEKRENLGDLNWIMENIRRDGFWKKESIEVRPHKDSQKLEIIDGRRRFRACLAVKESGNLGNWDGMIDIVPQFNMSDVDMVFKTINSNNESRKPFESFEEGSYFKMLIEEFNVDREEICKRIGKSLTYVSDRLNLVNMAPELKAEMSSFIQNGILSPTAAANIAKLPEKDQAKVWGEVKFRHNEQKVIEDNKVPTVINGKPDKKTKIPLKIKVKDVVKANKGTSDHISIKNLKANLELCEKMMETNSDAWEIAYNVLKAVSENRLYA
jgi:ParB/RepB/Spo0J family partition protein